jgi:hypothetical protein
VIRSVAGSTVVSAAGGHRLGDFIISMCFWKDFNRQILLTGGYVTILGVPGPQVPGTIPGKLASITSSEPSASNTKCVLYKNNSSGSLSSSSLSLSCVSSNCKIESKERGG